MSERMPAAPYILGLDIGTNSVGWALVNVDGTGHPTGALAAGVRVFPVPVTGDISSGLDKPRGAERRAARLRRRMLARRRQRLNKLAHLLQGAGLLPPGALDTPQDHLAFFADLDARLFSAQERKEAPHVLTYRLRARALDEPLSPHALGRALYHLAQRRGFLSNRRQEPKEGDEEGKVKKGISRTHDAMHAAGARTLGEYLASLDPTQERIRQRYTDRKMYQDEFAAIWAAQQPHHPHLLTEDLRKRVSRAIFFQRPLKYPRNRIGQCDLEPRCKRAPLALLAAQRFRLLQKVNDLQVITPDGEICALTTEERAKLVHALDTQGDLTWPKVRHLLGMTKEHRFNHEQADDRLIGNRTNARLVEVFGDRWWALSPAEREAVVDDVRSIEKPETIRARAMRRWGLDQAAAQALADVRLEEGYCSLSRRALAKVLPLLEEGLSYATARKRLYGEPRNLEPKDSLPPVLQAVSVRNPTVQRALTESRRVVNALVRRYGKPVRIRVELARDLKKNRKDRQAIHTRNRENYRRRETALRQILSGTDILRPKPADIEKWLLAEECRWRCPYTGKPISKPALFGPAPQFEVEHIIPRQRSFDNSFMNKTLCEHEENRTRKRNHTPWEAYGGDPQRWEEIITRVKSFTGSAARAKREQFMTGAPGGRDLLSLDDFATRQLNDTRYASRLAVEYLGALYGAGADALDAQGTRRLQASRGQITYDLRSAWGLNNILGGGDKTRDDHRQHAIDALVVALTDPATVKAFSTAASRAPGRARPELPPPWPGFLDEVRALVGRLHASHRAARKVAAAIHEETIYSKPLAGASGKPYSHVRKPLERLSPNEVKRIVDPKVRDLVERRLQDLGEDNPAKAFADGANLPALPAPTGRMVPIRKVRISVSGAVFPIAHGARQRHVKLGSNHHMEVMRTTDKRGEERWHGVVVTTYEAMRRLRTGNRRVINPAGDPAFLFSLCQGEVVELDDGPQGGRALFVVKKITVRGEGETARSTVGIVPLNDARMSTPRGGGEIRELREPSAEVLRRLHCRKVVVTPLGEVRRAGD